MPALPAELETKHKLLGLISTRTGKAIPFRFLDGAETIEVIPRTRLCVDDTNAHLAAGIAGLGILQAPAYMLGNALDSGQLVPVLKDLATPELPVHVIYAPIASLAPRCACSSTGRSRCSSAILT